MFKVILAAVPNILCIESGPSQAITFGVEIELHMYKYYTKYDILCYIVFNDIMVTFPMTLHMNERTNIVMDDG
jgi:hypothetical protein